MVPETIYQVSFRQMVGNKASMLQLMSIEKKENKAVIFSTVISFHKGKIKVD